MALAEVEGVHLYDGLWTVTTADHAFWFGADGPSADRLAKALEAAVEAQEAQEAAGNCPRWGRSRPGRSR